MKKEQGRNKPDILNKIQQYFFLFQLLVRDKFEKERKVDLSLTMEQRMQNVILLAMAYRVFSRKELTASIFIDTDAFIRASTYRYFRWIPELQRLVVTENGLRFVGLDIKDVSKNDLSEIFYRMSSPSFPAESPRSLT